MAGLELDQRVHQKQAEAEAASQETELRLPYADLIVVPDHVLTRANLRNLDLSNNSLIELPDAITRLAHL